MKPIYKFAIAIQWCKIEKRTVSFIS